MKSSNSILGHSPATLSVQSYKLRRPLSFPPHCSLDSDLALIAYSAVPWHEIGHLLPTLCFRDESAVSHLNGKLLVSASVHLRFMLRDKHILENERVVVRLEGVSDDILL